MVSHSPSPRGGHGEVARRAPGPDLDQEAVGAAQEAADAVAQAGERGVHFAALPASPKRSVEAM